MQHQCWKHALLHAGVSDVCPLRAWQGWPAYCSSCPKSVPLASQGDHLVLSSAFCPAHPCTLPCRPQAQAALTPALAPHPCAECAVAHTHTGCTGADLCHAPAQGPCLRKQHRSAMGSPPCLYAHTALPPPTRAGCTGMELRHAGVHDDGSVAQICYPRVLPGRV